MKENNIERLKTMYETELLSSSPFPYEDIRLAKRELKELQKIEEEECISGDLNHFFMFIAGTASKMIDDPTCKIESDIIEFLENNFFENYPVYTFLQVHLEKYENLKRKMMIYDKVRFLILDILRSN